MLYTSIFWVAGCRPNDVPETPVAPDVESIANRFFSPSGSLNEQNASDLGRWLLADGGAVMLASATLVQSVLPGLLDSIQSGLSQGNSADDTASELPFQAAGWLRFVLPCGEQDEQLLTLQALFSTAGLNPTIWGTSQCVWNDLGLALAGELSFFLPAQDWGGEQGSWLNIDGELTYEGYSLSGTHHLMIDTQNNARVLWEQGEDRFIIRAPIIDAESLSLAVDSLDEFTQLSISIETGNGTWQCELATASCSGPNGESIDL